jgi:hypothetical protein
MVRYLISQTIHLIKFLGSPFYDDDSSAFNYIYENMENFLLFSKLNKIELYFMNQLIKKRFKIDSESYENKIVEYNEYRKTLRRIVNYLNEEKYDYVIIKTIFDFQTIPNDVDILLYEEFNITEFMLEKNYEIVGIAPHQICYHDKRTLSHGPSNEKDRYDVDIYVDLKASYLTYINKNKIKKYIVKTSYDGVIVPVFEPGIEIMIISVHSVFPEFILTLSHYYSILYNLSKMSQEDINQLVLITKENNVYSSIRLVFDIVINLHYQAHGALSSNLEFLKRAFNIRLNPNKSYSMPHKFSFLNLLGFIYEKTFDPCFRRDVVKQMLFMCDYDNFKYVLSVIVNRFTRNTY